MAALSIYKDWAKTFAEREGIPVDLFNAMIGVESAWKPFATSNKGAAGLGQLMPGTAKELGIRNRYDPKQNLEGSAKYLARQYKKFGNWRDALAAYNAGPNRSKDSPGWQQGLAYADKVIKASGLDTSKATSILEQVIGAAPGGRMAQAIGERGGQSDEAAIQVPTLPDGWTMFVLFISGSLVWFSVAGLIRGR